MAFADALTSSFQHQLKRVKGHVRVQLPDVAACKQRLQQKTKQTPNALPGTRCRHAPLAIQVVLHSPCPMRRVRCASSKPHHHHQRSLASPLVGAIRVLDVVLRTYTASPCSGPGGHCQPGQRPAVPLAGLGMAGSLHACRRHDSLARPGCNAAGPQRCATHNAQAPHDTNRGAGQGACLRPLVKMGGPHFPVAPTSGPYRRDPRPRKTPGWISGCSGLFL